MLQSSFSAALRAQSDKNIWKALAVLTHRSHYDWSVTSLKHSDQSSELITQLPIRLMQPEDLTSLIQHMTTLGYTPRQRYSQSHQSPMIYITQGGNFLEKLNAALENIIDDTWKDIGALTYRARADWQMKNITHTIGRPETIVQIPVENLSAQDRKALRYHLETVGYTVQERQSRSQKCQMLYVVNDNEFLKKIATAQQAATQVLRDVARTNPWQASSLVGKDATGKDVHNPIVQMPIDSLSDDRYAELIKAMNALGFSTRKNERYSESNKGNMLFVSGQDIDRLNRIFVPRPAAARPPALKPS